MARSAPRLRLPDRVHDGARSFTRAELVEMSTERTVRTAIASGEVAAALPGRYGSTPHCGSIVVRAHAATTATRGVLTGAMALHVLGAVDRTPRSMLVAARPGCDLKPPPWLRLWRPAIPTLWLPWVHVPLAIPSLAALHAWMELGPERGTGAVLDALRTRLVLPEDLLDAARAAPRVPHRRRLLDVIVAFTQGAHSYLEYQGLRRVFAGKEFARFVRQHRVRVAGSVYFIDTYDPSTRLAIETDGDGYHGAPDRRLADIRRDADLATVGILTLRLSFADVTRRPEWCRETVRAVLRQRASGLRM